MYNPNTISSLLYNSLQQSNDPIKPGRFDGPQWSLMEAETGLTKRGSLEHGRILIGSDNEGILILLDGRHLLHAFVHLNKNIPAHSIAFETQEVFDRFQTLYSKLHLLSRQ